MGTPVEIKILRNGQVRIHWFCRRKSGPIHTGRTTHLGGAGRVVMGGSSGFVACQPGRKNLTSPVINGAIQPCPVSDDIQAVTCDLCMATAEFKKATEDLAAALGARFIKQDPATAQNEG